MSMLDGLLPTALLDTVMAQDVYVAIRSDATGNNLVGSGTLGDPYGGLESGVGWFDTVMQSKVNPEQAVRLGPGIFKTRGYNHGANTGWRPLNGMRIVGAGMVETILELVEVADTPLTSAVGLNLYDSTHFLTDGFEIENLSIHCGGGSAPANSSTAGITVTGKNICIHDVAVRNFGAKGTGWWSHGISAATAYQSISPPGSPLLPENCVVERCVVESPAVNNSLVQGIKLVSDTNGIYHKFCVVRNCYVSLNTIGTHVGVSICGGLGTIVEHNRVRQANYAVALAPTKVGGTQEINSSRDMIVRHNYFYDTPGGMNFNVLNAGRDCERLIVLNNVMEWGTNWITCQGLWLLGSAKVNKFICRGNVFRREDGLSRETMRFEWIAKPKRPSKTTSSTWQRMH